MSLKDFRNEYLDTVVDFLWAQWSGMGVPGNPAWRERRVIDPEALLLFTCTMGRFDARLFGEMLGWLRLHERWVSVQRLKNMLKKEAFQGGPVLGAVAASLTESTNVAKWGQLIRARKPAEKGAEALFFLRDGKPMPQVRKPDPVFEKRGFLCEPVELGPDSRPFSPEEPQNLLLKLRALFGVNSRCEVVAYLLGQEQAGVSDVADATYYFRRTVYNTLREMRMSGLLDLREQGGQNVYGIHRDRWLEFLAPGGPPPEWVNWPPLFGALEHIWRTLADPGVWGMSRLSLSAELRALMSKVRPQLERVASISRFVSLDSARRGEDYVDLALQDLGALLGILRAT